METERIRYIYRMTNLVNGKTYIGQHTLRKGRTLATDFYYGSGKLIQAAQRKYGLDKFKKEILISGNFSKEQISCFERCAINIERLLGKAEYNLANGGDGGDLSMFIDYKSRNQQASIEGYKKWALSHKEELSNKKKQQWRNGVYDNIDFSHPFSAETRKKLSESQKGEKNSQFGTHWYTNGEIDIKAKECPEGFRLGRHKK